MEPGAEVTPSHIHDPYWTVADYLRLTDHKSVGVRLWALERIEDLDVQVPAEALRRRLDDADDPVAEMAAGLVGRRRMTALEDVLLARLDRAEDAVGAACAQALAELGDRRVLGTIRRRSRQDPVARDPRIWLALSTLKGAEAADLLRQAFERIPPRGAASVASLLGGTLVLADPAGGIPRVVDRWVAETDEEEATILLEALLSLAEFSDGVDALRDQMRSDRETAWPGLPEVLLDTLADALPLGPIGEMRRACRKGKWGRIIETVGSLADLLATQTPNAEDIGLPSGLIRELGRHGKRLAGEPVKGRDAVGLMLLALTRIAQRVRGSSLPLPETPEERFRWLLSDAAVSYPDVEVLLVTQLAATPPSDAWITSCIRVVEQRAPSVLAAIGLLEAWRSDAAAPALVGLLGDQEDDALPGAAADALVAIGGAALDAVLERLAAAEDPALLRECLEICRRLPSRKAVEAICRRFEELFILVPDLLPDIVREIGAREFLEPLGRELREGEADAEEAFALLCDLHGVSDSRLPAIRKRQAARTGRLTGAVEDAEAAVADHLDLALTCTGCRRTYTYAVREVYVDPDAPEGEPFQPFIKDSIRCKGCGREDDYSLPLKTRLLLMGAVALLMDRVEKEGEHALHEGPVRLFKMGLSDGRRMNPREARQDYEARLATRPDDPDLLIGYANLMRFWGEADRAEAALRRALELDPRAAEAYATLGQLAEARGDLEAAERLYRQCLDQGWRARFYRAKGRRDFLGWVEEALVGVQGALAARPPDPLPAKERLDALVMDDRRGLKVGRNDPCPCGSGRKYKKCCLLKDSPPPGELRSKVADERLREHLIAYVERDLPKADFHRAMREFFRERFDPKTTVLALDPEENATEWPAFLEWLIHDFRLSTGQTPIATFLADRGHGLPADERAILEEWQDAAVGLHEVMDLDPGKSLTLRDVFTGETFRVREVRGSLSAARWDLFSSRVIRIQGEPLISGVCTVFRQSDREDLVRHVTERFQTYQREHPGASWRAFFRAESLIFHRYAEKLAREYVPPRVHTAEGHPVMLGRLQYAVRDDKRLLAVLSAAPDFEETTLADDPSNTRQFAWLRTGPAERFVREVPRPDHGLMLTNQRLDASGRVGIPGLATLTAVRGELTVEAMSAERLAWAKERLAELAGDLLQLRADIVEDPLRKGSAASSSRGDAQASAVPPEIERRLVGQMMHRHLTAWLDQALPALDGRTPRDVAHDLSLRPKVVQLLREIENYQDRARQQGKVWYDIAWLWEELGISRREA